jgi:protoheme IX farnesyltransferase
MKAFAVFALSLLFALAAYFIAVNHWITGWKFELFIVVLGLAQAAILMDRKVVSKYIALSKPGIIMGNGLMAFVGYAVGARGAFDWGAFLVMLGGLSSVIASGCAINNVIDRVADAKMHRTRNRPLVRGEVTPRAAIAFAMVSLGLGCWLLHGVPLALALFGWVIYVALYSPLKYRTVHGTLVGSVAGAMPPLIGYTAATGRVDAAGWILFAMVALWQMPHFYAIAIYRMEEYKAAGIPVLPLVRGIESTRRQMFIYVIAFIVVSTMLTIYMSLFYLVAILALGFGWLFLSLRGGSSPTRWARHMFLYSLVVVMGLTFLAAQEIFTVFDEKVVLNAGRDESSIPPGSECDNQLIDSL